MENPSANHSHAAARAGAIHGMSGYAAHATTHATTGAAFAGIVYTAEAPATFDEARLREFRDAAVKRNARLGLTGHAYVHGGRVVEYIEGPAEAVEEAYAAIEADPSMTIYQAARAQTLAQRRFSAWRLETCGADLMELRLEHVLETVLHNLAAALFGAGDNLCAIWRLVDAIARRQVKTGKPVGAGSTRLVFAH